MNTSREILRVFHDWKDVPVLVAHATLSPNFSRSVEDFLIGCREIIPAGVYSPRGGLTPGCAEVTHQAVTFDQNVDARLVIKVRRVPDLADLDYRAGTIVFGLQTLMPENTYGVWIEPVDVDWASNAAITHISDYTMSLSSALARASWAIAQLHRMTG